MASEVRKGVAAVGAGYLTMYSVVVVFTTALWRVTGPNFMFEPNSWQITTHWAIWALLIETSASFLGGFACHRLGGRNPTIILALVKLFIGAIVAIVYLRSLPTEEARPNELQLVEALEKSRELPWTLYAEPCLAAFAVLFALLIGEAARMFGVTDSTESKHKAN